MAKQMNFSDLNPEQLQRIYIRDELLKMVGEKWKEKAASADAFYHISFQQWYGVFDLPILIEEELIIHRKDLDTTTTKAAGPLQPFNYELTAKGLNTLKYINSWILIGNFYGVDIIDKQPGRPWTDAERAEWLKKQGQAPPKAKSSVDWEGAESGWKTERQPWPEWDPTKVPPAGAAFDHARVGYEYTQSTARSTPLNDKEKADFKAAWERVTQEAKKTSDKFGHFNDLFEGADYNFSGMTEEMVAKFLEQFWGIGKNGRRKK